MDTTLAYLFALCGNVSRPLQGSARLLVFACQSLKFLIRDWLLFGTHSDLVRMILAVVIHKGLEPFQTHHFFLVPMENPMRSTKQSVHLDRVKFKGFAPRLR